MQKEQLTAYMEYSEKRFTKKNVFKEDGMNAFVLNFLPGQELPSHIHPKARVCLLVLKGQGTFTINQEKVPVAENDVLFAREDEELGFINDSPENTSIYVVLNRMPKTEQKNKDRGL